MKQTIQDYIHTGEEIKKLYDAALKLDEEICAMFGKKYNMLRVLDQIDTIRSKLDTRMIKNITDAYDPDVFWGKQGAVKEAVRAPAGDEIVSCCEKCCSGGDGDVSECMLKDLGQCDVYTKSGHVVRDVVYRLCEGETMHDTIIHFARGNSVIPIRPRDIDFIGILDENESKKER